MNDIEIDRLHKALDAARIAYEDQQYEIRELRERLTAAQAAERLGCSVAQVKAMCKEGKLRAEKFGNAWVIRAADLAGVTLAKPGWPLGRKRKPEP